jgi:hypothetical protein
MRRTHLKTHAKILNRLLIHVAGCNLALVMRTLFGVGTPKALQDLVSAFLHSTVGFMMSVQARCRPWGAIKRLFANSTNDIDALYAA